MSDRSIKKINFLSQSFKLIIYFAGYVLAYQILFFEFNFNSLVSAVLMNEINTPKLFVVPGSYWFVPTYVASLSIATILIGRYGNLFHFYIIFTFIYFWVSFFSGEIIDASLLGVSFDKLIFYSSCILIGYGFVNSKRKEIYYAVPLLFFLIWIFMIFHDNKYFQLQLYKFPLSLPYVLASCLSVFVAFGLVSRMNFKVKLLTFIGSKSIHFYLSQGISSTIIYMFVDKISSVLVVKISIIFTINFILFYFIGFFICVFYEFLMNFLGKLNINGGKSVGSNN